MQERTAIKIATQSEAERVVDALVLAFSADPLTRYAFPEPTQHRIGFGAFVRAFGGAALDRGTAYVTEGFAPPRSGWRQASSPTRKESSPASTRFRANGLRPCSRSSSR
jgi:hypothetical protein